MMSLAERLAKKYTEKWAEEHFRFPGQAMLSYFEDAISEALAEAAKVATVAATEGYVYGDVVTKDHEHGPKMADYIAAEIEGL